jgi:mannitol/fructose-specific phosphotransferase system IIA component (Ntr-type)
LLWFPQTIGRRASFGIRRFSIAEPSTRTKQQAIRAVLDRLVEVGALETEHREGVLAAILKREELGSTGIGRGVAVPHAKYAGLKTPLCAIAEFKFGIDFESLDGQPVRSICLLVSPPDFAGEHVRVLAELAHLLSAVG